MNHSKSFSRISVLAGAALALLCGGCATPSKPTAMVADMVQVQHKHAASVTVNVTGGADTSAMGASNISNDDFAAAIRSSIEQSGVFASIASAGAGDYQINAQIVRLDRPMFGFSFTVTMEVSWRLLRVSSQEVVWEKAITSSFTATTGDAFVGVTRLRLANEGAARENIKDAITQLGSLALP